MRKCKFCGSADIETDSARGHAVCTSCGFLLEDNIIVSEVTFEEGAHGSSAIGQFVPLDSKGGATGYGKFPVGTGTESREVTLRKAKLGITHLCQQLFLSNHCIETAHNFFKMALSRQLTRGRRNTHIYAACVYITCRTEGTSHLLIDISDALQICCYELGRTYLKLSQALCINIPSIDPCIYIMRFANRLEFADKTHEVSMTAQRLVQRMKKDSIHSGRRPSGLCGAALLLAARMHEFNRTPIDIVRVVKIHESTLRKRLLEFGETPSSNLTVDEFMAIDLEAEQDPPAFRAARKKDKERMQKIGDNESEFTSLQIEIDAALERDLKKNRKRKLNVIPGVPAATAEVFDETKETDLFIGEQTLSVISECLDGKGNKEIILNGDEIPEPETSERQRKLEALCRIKQIDGIKPDLVAMCTITEDSSENVSETLAAAFSGYPSTSRNAIKEDLVPIAEDLNLEGLDDDEINGYILTESEAVFKDRLWNKMNAEYLVIAKAREERLAKEKEEGKPEKKKRKSRKKNIGPSNSAGEAIEKMLQEKKISSKINYDILKTLTAKNEAEDVVTVMDIESMPIVIENTPLPSTSRRSNINLINSKRSIPTVVDDDIKAEAGAATDNDDIVDTEDEHEPAPELEPETGDRLADMLNQGNDEDGYYGYDDY
ncbi:unnamed protein product [Diamesa serratosioi]